LAVLLGSLTGVLFVIWALVEDNGPRSLWEQRYTIYVTDLCHPIGLLPDSGSAMMLWLSHILYRYDLQSHELTVVCELEKLRYERPRKGSFWSAKRHSWKKGLQSRFVKTINPGCRNRD
jgi:hypothetical protein